MFWKIKDIFIHVKYIYTTLKRVVRHNQLNNTYSNYKIDVIKICTNRYLMVLVGIRPQLIFNTFII